MLQRNDLAKPIPSIMDNALDSNTNTSKTHQNPLSHPPLTLDSILKEIKSGSGHLQGISKPGEWKHRVEPWLFCFLALGKACFPSHSLTHSLIPPPHMLDYKSTKKCPRWKIWENSARQWIFPLFWQPLWGHKLIRGWAACLQSKNDGCQSKKMRKKVLLKGGRVPNMPGIPRSGAMTSGMKCCEEWQCQSKTSLVFLVLSICWW